MKTRESLAQLDAETSTKLVDPSRRRTASSTGRVSFSPDDKVCHAACQPGCAPNRTEME